MSCCLVGPRCFVLKKLLCKIDNTCISVLLNAGVAQLMMIVPEFIYIQVIRINSVE